MRERKPCINGDGRPAKSRGRCNACYLRYMRSTPKAERAPIERPADEERFFSFVNKMGPIARNRPDLGRCWLWGGGDCREYGIFWADGTSHRAHVWSYKHFVAEIPDGLTLDHFACDQPGCVNYLHVRPATHQVNILRSGGLGALNAAKTRCGVCGEPYDEKNTRINANGARVCLRCAREKDREAKAAKRLAISERIRLEPGAGTCRNGHEVTPENTYVYQRFPSCRSCAIAEGVTRALPKVA
jgi:hypothetical protein